MNSISPFNLYAKQMSFGQNGANQQQAAGASQYAAAPAAAQKIQGAPLGVKPAVGLEGGVKSSGMDQLAQFRNQIASGAIKPNLSAPALPYNATQGWTA